MPLIDLTYPQGALTDEQGTELADELTTVLGAGRPVAKPSFKPDDTTPQGALSDRRRRELVAEATPVVRHGAGIAEQDALRVWGLTHEILEGQWGAAGQVVEFAQLRAGAQDEREQVEPVAGS